MTEKKNGKIEKVNMAASLAFLLLLGIYSFIMFKYRPLSGDDFSIFYKKEVSGYIDPELAATQEYHSVTGLSFQEYLENMKNSYMTYSGRVVPCFFAKMLAAVNDRMAFAVLGAFVYLFIPLLAGRMVFHKIREVLRHPLVLVLMGSFFWLYNEMVGSFFMFTMLFHYGVPTLLWLLMLNFCLGRIWQEKCKDEKREEQEKGKKKKWPSLVGMNLLGLIAGLSHELVGATALLMIASMTLLAKGFREGMKEIRFYVGAACGYLICFFAPGNFNRAGTEHDATIYDPYFTKLYASLKNHVAFFVKMEEIGRWFLIAAALLFLIGIILKRKKREKFAWKKALFWQASVAASVLLWAAVSYVPRYGLILPMACEFTALLRLFYDPSEDLVPESGGKQAVLLSVLAVVFIVMIGCNLRWVPQMVEETLERNRLIEEAVSAGEEEVLVPSYSDNVTSHSVMIANYINNSDYYRRYEITQLYYGITIVMEE